MIAEGLNIGYKVNVNLIKSFAYIIGEVNIHYSYAI